MRLGGQPAAWLLAAVLLAVASVVAAIWVALEPPRLGVRLAVEGEAVMLRAVDPAGPAASVPLAPLAALGQGTQRITLLPTDLVEDPGAFTSHEVRDPFWPRQSALTALLEGPDVALVVNVGGTERAFIVRPVERRLSDLPTTFWVQLVFGVIALLVGAWVWALRPNDWATGMFALTGLSMLTFTHAAAIYSTRELALDGGTFRLLAALNEGGAMAFGAAMIALFLRYPRPVAGPPILIGVLVVFGAWYVASLLKLLPTPDMGGQLGTAVEMLLILVTIAVQWWATRRDVRERAALRWLGLSVALGAGAFIVAVVAPPLLGLGAGLNQGYSFGFFLLIYAGLALGLRRYRLFELGEWAFRILFYTGAAMLMVALDAALILWLQWGPESALGVALLAVAFLYLPLREMLWRRTVARRSVPQHELFAAALDVAFAVGADERAARWQGLLNRLFDPLDLAPAVSPVTQPMIGQDGIELTVPAIAGTPSLVLRHPWRGRGLFGPVHQQLARQLIDLLHKAEDSRAAYERGALGERRRIAQDLHDDVGARLLSGLHRSDLAQVRDTVREALADIRAIVSGLGGERLPLARVLADLRHEGAERLAAAGIALDWPPGEGDDDAAMLDYQVYRNIMSALREVISNVIRHAGAKSVTVRVAVTDGRLHLTVADDGAGMINRPGGHGLTNIARRLESLGGAVSYPPVASGVTVALQLPLGSPA